MSDRRHRQQSGSVTVLVAAMSLILVAFVGLSVDGGEIETQQRESQNAADGAALAAATAIINADNYGYTTTDAKNIGGVVATYNGIASSDVGWSLVDLTGNPTTDPHQVATVTANVTHTFSTLFLPVMDINTATVKATATVSITQATGTNCGLCALSPNASPAVWAQNGGSITVSGGPLKVLSNGNPAITKDSGASTKIEATAVTSVGPVSGSTTPTAQTGSTQTFTDPLASVPTPTLGLTASDVTYSSNATITPGTYGAVTIPSGVTITMQPGVYIFAGGLTVNGTLNGNSVMMYFPCRSGSVSAACAAGQDGGNINIAGSMTVSAPPEGSSYTGLVLYGDRNNTATIAVSGSIIPTGTIYGAAMTLYIPHGSHQSLTSRVVVGAVNVDNSGQLNITYAASGNYVAPGKLKMTA
jgi:hypothetical protein